MDKMEREFLFFENHRNEDTTRLRKLLCSALFTLTVTVFFNQGPLTRGCRKAYNDRKVIITLP